MELELHELLCNADASDISVGGAAALNTDRIKMLTLSKIQPKPKRKAAPRIFLAAAIAATLAVSALAYAEFKRYEHPEQMLDGFYGNTQQESVIDQKAPWGQLPDSERVPLDRQAAQQAAPYIAAVDKTVRSGDLSLTVHGNLYDSVTGCGILYYTLENPKGFDYELGYDGMIWDIPVYGGTRHGYAYLLKDASTTTSLDIAEYYIRGPHDSENYIEVGLDLPGGYGTEEEEFDRAQKAIQIPLDDGGGMDGLCGQGIRLSPIGIALDFTEMPLPAETETNDDNIKALEILFRDGSRYVVQDETHRNYIFGAGSDNQHLVLSFNRLVAVDQVGSILVNGCEIKDMKPIEEDQRLRYSQYVDQRGRLDQADSVSSGSITFEEITLIPGKLQYCAATGNGLFTCTLQTDHPEKLLQNGYFSPWDAKLQSNFMIRWECLKQEKRELSLQGTFIKLDEKADSLKLWFEGSNADPRLDASTENLLCIPLEETSGNAFSLADGAILVSDLGMVIDYEALDVIQESLPRDLSITFTDGSSKILSSWDEEILDCGWIWTGELRDHPVKRVYISFLESLNAETVQSVAYAGHVYEK